MGEVVEFLENDVGKGYLTDDNCKTINGVYVNNIAAMVEHKNVYLGTKSDDGIDDALLTNKKDMDEFCLMWLLINNPDVIKEDYSLEV